MARPKQRNGPPQSKGIHTTPSIRSASVAIFIEDLFCMLPVLQFLHSGSVVTMGVHLAKLAGSCSDERKQLVSMMLAVFDEQGYVVVPSLLSDLQLTALHKAFLNVPKLRWEPRDPNNRWSCTHRLNNLDPDWPLVWQCPMVDAFVKGVCELLDCQVCVGSVGGDVVSPGARAQQLHSDWGRYDLCSMKYGYIMAVSIATVDVGAELAPLRICSWSDRRGHKYPQFGIETSDLCVSVTMQRGDLLIRDVRTCHGGSANFSSVSRPLPGGQIYCSQSCTGTCFLHKHWSK